MAGRKVSDAGPDPRKQSLYFPDDVLAELRAEAQRQDRSISWLVQMCVKMGLPKLRQLPPPPTSPSR